MSDEWQQLPKGWALSSIGDHLVKYHGGAPLAPRDFTREGVKVLPKKGVNASGVLQILDEDQSYTSSQFAAKYARCTIEGGSFLATTLRDLVPTGPSIGLIVTVPNDRYVLSQGVYAFQLAPSLQEKFLVYLSQTPQHRRQMRAMMVGSTQVHIRTNEFFTCDIPLPPVGQQRKIARILTTLDELIEKTEALIAKYQAVKQGMMNDLFTRGVDEHGHLRPTYNEAPELYKESELGWIPKEWEVVPVTNITLGGPKNGYFKKPELVGSGYKLVNVTDLYQPYGIDTDHPAVERVEASDADFTKYGVVDGDLFITRSSLVLTGIAHCNTVRKTKEPTLFECHVMRLRPSKDLVDSDFLALYLQTTPARSHFMARAKQVAMTTISQPDISSLPVLLPPLHEQKQIAKSILAVEERWRREVVACKKFRSQKTGLMQDLLTGKVRAKPDGGGGDV